MSDIVITRLQLEAWATAMRAGLDGWRGGPEVAAVAMEQALEDMTDELADPDEIDVIEDAALYDPDAVSDGWEAAVEEVEDDGDDDGFDKVWYH